MNFKEAIKCYLDNYAKENTLFANSYVKPGKNISKCCDYIISCAEKEKDNRVAVISDDQVFQWARHYYEEDDDKLDLKHSEVKVSSTSQTSKPVEKAKETKEVKAKKEIKKDYDQLDLMSMLGDF